MGTKIIKNRWQLNQLPPPLERLRVVVPHCADARSQSAHEAFLFVFLLQIKRCCQRVHDLVQERVLHCVVVLIFTDRNDLQIR